MFGWDSVMQQAPEKYPTRHQHSDEHMEVKVENHLLVEESSTGIILQGAKNTGCSRRSLSMFTLHRFTAQRLSLLQSVGSL